MGIFYTFICSLILTTVGCLEQQTGFQGKENVAGGSRKLDGRMRLRSSQGSSGCSSHRTGLIGGIWERPSPCSGYSRAEDDDDDGS
uniref:Putative secreted protein n=1 Tax=Amblyomma triste TaxID=251400 RepID=A0A023G3N7_AMBTT